MKFTAVALIVVFALATLIDPLRAEAQQAGKVYRIGLLTLESPSPQNLPLFEAFEAGLREHGWVAGQNVTIERRASEGRPERLPDLADELIRLKVDVIVTVTNAAAHAVKRRTDTIPISMAISALPDRLGLVASVARPGGNVTGLSLDIGPEIVGKMLQLLKETAPAAARVTVILGSGPMTDLDPWTNAAHLAAQALRLTLHFAVVRSLDEFKSAFDTMAQARAQALVADNSALVFVQRRSIIEFAAKHRLPAVYAFRECAESGGLMAYGADLKDLFRRTGIYVDKILRGAKPGDLPVEQPTKFELVVNRASRES